MLEGFIQLVQIAVDAIKTKTDNLPANTSTTLTTINNDVKYSTGIIVEDTSVATPKITTLQTSASANTWGTIVEHDSSVSADSYLNSMYITPDSPGNYCVDLCTGTSGAEVAIAHFSFVATSVGSSFDESFDSSFISNANTIPFFWTRRKKVASGTRLSLRVSCSEAGQRTVYVSVQYDQD